MAALKIHSEWIVITIFIKIMYMYGAEVHRVADHICTSLLVIHCAIGAIVYVHVCVTAANTHCVCVTMPHCTVQ